VLLYRPQRELCKATKNITNHNTYTIQLILRKLKVWTLIQFQSKHHLFVKPLNYLQEPIDFYLITSKYYK
jgi:hypothetical protein